MTEDSKRTLCLKGQRDREWVDSVVPLCSAPVWATALPPRFQVHACQWEKIHGSSCDLEGGHLKRLFSVLEPGLEVGRSMAQLQPRGSDLPDTEDRTQNNQIQLAGLPRFR